MARRPEAYFVVSAVFHYFGPSLAVLLFARVDVLGVAWLRIAAAAVVFALWRRPWRLWRGGPRGARGCHPSVPPPPRPAPPRHGRRHRVPRHAGARRVGRAEPAQPARPRARR